MITGMFEHVPVQMFRATFEPGIASLGKNKIVAIRDGKYDPSVAVNQVEDLVQSGTKFSVLFVFNEEMAAAVVRSLKARNLLNNPIKVVAQNGAPYGLDLIRDGSIKYSISSSPGWEGMISALALNAYTTGKIKTKNQQIVLPITPITAATINDMTKVVPWDVNPVWLDLTHTHFPQYNGMY
jgi:ribose transport system substrate-binding protein